MIPRTIEESLNGGFRGLYGEVVTCDIYRLRTVDFQPDVIFDIGANIGIFTRFARQLFPAARIVAVEPHPDNIENFKHWTPPDPNLTLIEAAMGFGRIFRGTTACNGSGESYVSLGPGFPSAEVLAAAVDQRGMEGASVPAMNLEQIIRDHWHAGEKALIKIDCEGAENCIWLHPPSMLYLSQMDYICMELHDYGITLEAKQVVERITAQGLNWLGQTHNWSREGVNFWARKRV